MKPKFVTIAALGKLWRRLAYKRLQNGQWILDLTVHAVPYFNQRGEVMMEIRLQRFNCPICNRFTMLLALNHTKLEHAQCGNDNCKSNKEGNNENYSNTVQFAEHKTEN
jgi:hypothetical protein